MSAPWEQYQEQAATVFRRMGLNAEVDKDIEGVRGVHAIDVYVSGIVYGLEIKWVIECKAWRSNIPKEKVLALFSIVQDIGADKGILLSEVGFQSGAIKSARGTNILLTSIADLEEQVQADFKESTLSKLSWRLSRVKDRLRTLDADAQDYEWTPQLKQQLRLMPLDVAFRKASNNEFPVVYAIEQENVRLSAQDFDDLVIEADGLLRSAEEHCDIAEQKPNR